MLGLTLVKVPSPALLFSTLWKPIVKSMPRSRGGECLLCHYKPILNARTIFYFMDLPSFSQYPNAIHFCCFGFSFTNKATENLNFRFNKYFSSNFPGTGTAHSGKGVCASLSFCFLRANSRAGIAGPKDQHVVKAFDKHH